MKALYVIPARGGSKGIPRKNIKPLGGKPLILWSTELARSMAPDCDVCVSSDSEDIIRVVQASGLEVPFVRPSDLATDTAGTHEVLLHALSHYKKCGISYDAIVLLQPTSPFRQARHLEECLELYQRGDTSMVVSVRAADAIPYYNLFEESKAGYLEISKQATFTRRQDCPPVFQLNGSIYVMSVPDLYKYKIAELPKVRKYVMSALWSVDLDTPLDWIMAETLLSHGLLNRDDFERKTL